MSIADKLVTIAENQQKVYDAAVKSEYDRFWDRVQQNGAKQNYGMAFSMSIFPRPAFDPKYDMNVTNAQYMFSYWSNYLYSEYGFELDLRNCGVNIDFSQSTSFQSTFQTNYQLVAVGLFDTRSAKSLANTFYYSTNLHTIEKLIVKDDGSQTFSNTFTNCAELKNITVEGTVGTSISFQWSPLTGDSIRSVVNALSTTATGQTATFRKTAKEAAFTADEWAALIATKSNWTFSLV